MGFFIIELLYGLITTISGAAVATWLCWAHFRRKAARQTNTAAQHAAEVLLRLQELTTRVAFDVDEHSSQVEEINDELTSAASCEAAEIVDVVAKLIEANQHMHEKLASTEGKLRKQAQEMQTHAVEARTDALTLLANRRAFDGELARRVAEFQRHGRGFSLIMADVDHFKKFNDAHGHPAGDEVLRGVAKVLRRKIREMDLVARYGGEEFAIILPGTSQADAGKAAIRACEGIAHSHFRCEGQELQVTMSLGLAQTLANEDGIALVARADKALYAAKAGGRNCVYWHDGTTVQPLGSGPPPACAEAAGQRQDGLVPGGQKKDERVSPASEHKAVKREPALPHAVELDAVPDLPSRTTFCQHVRNRTAEWKRGGPTFSVVLLEVNQYDQGEGASAQRGREAATRAATRFLTATAREMDSVGHYAPGGFALLLPTAGLGDALRVAERLREGFSQCTASAQGAQSELTLNVGVVQVMDKDDSISLLKRAEAALDAAHRRGGNRAYYHDGERCAPITAMLEAMDYLA